jgi:hypothetical protein
VAVAFSIEGGHEDDVYGRRRSMLDGIMRAIDVMHAPPAHRREAERQSGSPPPPRQRAQAAGMACPRLAAKGRHAAAGLMAPPTPPRLTAQAAGEPPPWSAAMGRRAAARHAGQLRPPRPPRHNAQAAGVRTRSAARSQRGAPGPAGQRAAKGPAGRLRPPRPSRQGEEAGLLGFLAINVNDYVKKSSPEDVYGYRHSLPNGIMVFIDGMRGDRLRDYGTLGNQGGPRPSWTRRACRPPRFERPCGLPGVELKFEKLDVEATAAVAHVTDVMIGGKRALAYGYDDDVSKGHAFALSCAGARVLIDVPLLRAMPRPGLRGQEIFEQSC